MLIKTTVLDYLVEELLCIWWLVLLIQVSKWEAKNCYDCTQITISWNKNLCSYRHGLAWGLHSLLQIFKEHQELTMLPWSWCFPMLRPFCHGKTIPGYPALHREKTHFPGWFAQWHWMPFLKMTREGVQGLADQQGSPQTLWKITQPVFFWYINKHVKNKNFTI